MNEIALRLAARLFDQPLIQNQYRSAFIEAMLEPALTKRGWRHVGDNWSGWDFEHTTGIRLEVKQSAAWQTWDPAKLASTANSPARAGPGIFDIAARTGWFDETGAIWTKNVGRAAHVYVFAWNGQFGELADHRDPDQWEFFIAPAAALPAQKTLRLSRLRTIARGPVKGHERCAGELGYYVQA
jgi:hypothetical protein